MPNPGSQLDLIYATMVQNNLLLALVRSHPNRDVLATNYQNAQELFPNAANAAASDPVGLQLTASIVEAIQTSFEKSV